MFPREIKVGKQMCTYSHTHVHTHTHTHTHIHTYTYVHTRRTVEYLDSEQGKWLAVENMLSRRSTLGVAVFNGELYAVGGFDGTTGLDTVERYNPGMVCVCEQVSVYVCVRVLCVFV